MSNKAAGEKRGVSCWLWICTHGLGQSEVVSHCSDGGGISRLPLSAQSQCPAMVCVGRWGTSYTASFPFSLTTVVVSQSKTTDGSASAY
jgi:hypothetical protein